MDLGSVRVGDEMIIRTGNLIPLDGFTLSGEAMVNQASITGEPLSVRKNEVAPVYAGTVVESGKIVVRVDKEAGSGQYDRIIKMIEDSSKMKSDSETKATQLADRLVPWTFVATAFTYLLTRNFMRAYSILMVDYSCALKLAIPISVLSAMREASDYHVSAKAGVYVIEAPMIHRL